MQGGTPLKTQSKKPLSWINISFLTLSPFLAIALVIWHFKIESWHNGLIILFIIYYLITGLSITAGYHRLFSHRSYKTNKIVRLIYLIFGAATFQNSALKWCTDHRQHHNNVDTHEDPYNIKQGFFYAHMGWIFYDSDRLPLKAYPKDLANDPLVVWQHRYYIPIAIFTGIIFPALLGYWFFNAPIGGLAFGGFIRIVFVHHCTFFINSLCHTLGDSTFTDENSAKDSTLLAFFTYGEGYHNFHHKFQIDFRNGIKWYHFDPTKWTILTLSWFGMAGKLKKVTDEEIIRARIFMDEKRLKQKVPADCSHLINGLEQLKLQVVHAQEKFQLLKKDYQALKLEIKKFPEHGREKMLTLQTKLKMAKMEMKLAYSHWNIYTKSIYQLNLYQRA